jgi:para-aminobenzoate synthetase component 1
VGAVKTTLNKKEYQQQLERIQEHILSGDVYQINFAQRFQCDTKNAPWDIYLQLRANNPAPFSAFICAEDHAILSLSPERFLQIDREGHVETKPIKGTRPRSSDPIEDKRLAQELANSIKDRAENVMIVDLLRNDLSKNCIPGTVKVPQLFTIESYPAVHHLVSTVTGQLRPDRHALDCLRDCFPGGSITGAPKIRAMQIIEALESHRRGIYCGSIGYVSHCGNLQTNIAIRTLMHQNNQLTFWAGGGIVADSQTDHEYQECFDKIHLFLKTFEAFYNMS